MVKFILTLEDIPKELYRNYKSYYDYYHKIPINCSYLLYLMPYYKNSSHKFRLISNKTDFELLLKGILENKPRSNKVYNMGKFYIPGQPNGPILKNEVYPISVSRFNNIPKDIYISEILFYSTHQHRFNPIIKLTNDIEDKVIAEIEFIAYNIEKVYNMYKYQYIPKNKYKLPEKQSFSINLSELELDYIINNNYTKKFFTIICDSD